MLYHGVGTSGRETRNKMKRVFKRISDLPNGSVFYYRRKAYFVSAGVSDRIVTSEDGHWTFIRDLKWKTFRIAHVP